MKKIAKNILYCDECHDLIMPKQKFHPAGGRIICTICWGDADADEEEVPSEQ